MSAALAGAALYTQVVRGRGRLAVRAAVASAAAKGGGRVPLARSSSNASTFSAKPPAYLSQRPWEAARTAPRDDTVQGTVAALGLAKTA